MKIRFIDTAGNITYALESSKGITVWTDNVSDATLDEYKNDIRVLVLHDAPSISNLTEDKIKKISANYHYIFTFLEELLNLSNAIKFLPYDGFISLYQLGDKKEDITEPKKKCEMLFICGSDGTTEGHKIRKRMWDQEKEIKFQHTFLTDNNKELLDTSMFNLVIEDDKIPNLFTEKINDCFLTKTVPVYYGDPHIGNIFNIKGMIVVDKEKDIIETINSLTEESYTSKLEYITDNHKRILKRIENAYPMKYKHIAEPLIEKIKIKEMCAENTKKYEITHTKFKISDFYKKDEGLNEYLCGKRIAYVCPAKYLVGRKMGKIIDSYDIVCRVGELGPVNPKLHEDYGSRTDIILTAGSKWWFDEVEKNDNIDYICKNVKYVVNPRHSREWGCYVADTIDNYFRKITNDKVPFHQVSEQYAQHINSNVAPLGSQTGTLGLIIFLNYPIKELFVTGMDFFNFGKYAGINSYYDSYPGIDIMRIRHYKGGIGHQQKPQMYFFEKLLKEYKMIKIDDYMKLHFK